jgi:hypothetical protein
VGVRSGLVSGVPCVECGGETYPMKFRVGTVDKAPVALCAKCRGRRAAKVNREKRERHGPGYFACKKGSHDARGRV